MIVEKLGDFPMLSEFKIQELRQLAAFLEVKTYKDGECILGEHNPNSSLLFIFSGEVRVFRNFPRGGSFALTIGKNEIFGEVAFADQKGRMASASAIGEAQIGAFPYEHFEVIKKQDPVFGMKLLMQLLKLLAGKFRFVNKQLDNLLMGAESKE